MPGMSAENSVPSISIGRPRRRAISMPRSMLKPSTPPPSFGMACGAKVASTPVLIGWLAWATAAPEARLSVTAATRLARRGFMAPSRGSRRYCAFKPAPARRPPRRRAPRSGASAPERLAGPDPLDNELVVLRPPVRGEVEHRLLEVRGEIDVAVEANHLVGLGRRLHRDLA